MERQGMANLNSGGGVQTHPTKILTVLHNFDRTPVAGWQSALCGLIQAATGISGVASAGGTNAAGTLYEITAPELTRLCITLFRQPGLFHSPL